MKRIIAIAIALIAIIWIGAVNLRATIAEPATSTTSVAATTALGTTAVIQQLTLCIGALGFLFAVLFGSAALGFIYVYKPLKEIKANSPSVAPSVAPARVIIMPDQTKITNPVSTIQRTTRHKNRAAKAAARMFR
jgi:hypothetical protein